MYKGKKVIHILARGKNGEIGKDNRLLWSISEELKYFKDCTLGHVVLMGRKTYESLPKPLERRVVLNVTKFPHNESAFGRSLEMTITDYLDEAEHCCNEILNTDIIFIAGGSQLYKATENIVDELWITEVDQEYPDADKYYDQPKGFEKYYSKAETNCLDRKHLKGVNLEFTKWKRVNK
jgi:dihydrofolate reductase